MLLSASELLEELKSARHGFFTYAVVTATSPPTILRQFSDEDAILFEMAFSDMCREDPSCALVNFNINYRGVDAKVFIAAKVPEMQTMARHAIDQYKERENA